MKVEVRFALEDWQFEQLRPVLVKVRELKGEAMILGQPTIDGTQIAFGVLDAEEAKKVQEIVGSKVGAKGLGAGLCSDYTSLPSPEAKQ